MVLIYDKCIDDIVVSRHPEVLITAHNKRGYQEDVIYGLVLGLHDVPIL